jgi:hypothetical protein
MEDLVMKLKRLSFVAILVLAATCAYAAAAPGVAGKDCPQAQQGTTMGDKPSEPKRAYTKLPEHLYGRPDALDDGYTNVQVFKH